MSSDRREELAWVAGFFSGEGWIGVVSYSVKGRRYWRISSHVAQAEETVLKRLQCAIGRGTVNGPYRHKNRSKDKPYWVYQTSGLQDTQHLIVSIWPWLSRTKRLQAKQAMVRILLLTNKRMLP